MNPAERTRPLLRTVPVYGETIAYDLGSGKLFLESDELICCFVEDQDERTVIEQILKNNIKKLATRIIEANA